MAAMEQPLKLRLLLVNCGFFFGDGSDEAAPTVPAL
jgi:hypothetical protein